MITVSAHAIRRAQQRIGDMTNEQARTLLIEAVERGQLATSADYAYFGVRPDYSTVHLVHCGVLVITDRYMERVITVVTQRKGLLFRAKRHAPKNFRGMTVSEALELLEDDDAEQG